MKNIIKKNKIVLASLLFLTLNFGCNDFLEVESLTKMPVERLLTSEAGIQTMVANMYNGIPMEDFSYRPNAGFNRRGWQGGIVETLTASMYTDEAIMTHGNVRMGRESINIWNIGYTGDNIYQINAWDRNRQISLFQRNIEQAKNDGVISESTYNRLKSESHFARAYMYYALAKRYGGVPIIDWVQDDEFKETGNPAPLFIPRKTESETWKYVMSECDKAIEFLPLPSEFTSKDGDPRYRASKWAAYALKSRAALHAASIAKYGNRVQFTGEAVNQKLVGLDPAEAAFFYNECITASKAIIDQGGYSLYKPNPANAEEAAKNYQYIFLDIPVDEVIFGKNYLPGNQHSNSGHSFDIYHSPSQGATGFHKWGRFSVALNIVDLYEDYTDDGNGLSAPIVTRTDGIETDVITVNNPSAAQVTSIPFVKYSDPSDPFTDKDARLHGSVIVPGGMFKGVKIVMQGGLITSQGGLMLYQGGSAVGLDGNTYYTYGAQSPSNYSGFATMTSSDDANYSSTGFTIRKFLAENQKVPGIDRSSSTPFIDFRLAEIYLNYAEAVVESGSGSTTDAAKYINALRKRAGHTDNIPLTLDNVMKERRVEMAFEQQIRIWDLLRRREYHTMFNGFQRNSLVQLVDLRENPPKYVFLRMKAFPDVSMGASTFNVIDYYWNIPGVDVSGLINNPGR